jgi:dTDP-L-rhamnose 4-epimerase
MKALVTGGAGFIGSHIADALLERSYEVKVLDNLESRVHPYGRATYLDERVRLLKGDTRDRAAMESALDGADVVFHMADYQGYMADYAKFFHSNVVSTALLFEVIREKRLPVRKVVIGSSQAVYGEGQYYCASHGLVLPDSREIEQLDRGEWEIQCAECGGSLVPVLLREGRTNPASPYGLSKLAQEQAAFRLGKLLEIPVVALRYSSVQGPRQSSLDAFCGLSQIFTDALEAGKAPAIFEDGKQLRDYVHVSDAVEASMLVLDDPLANGQAFNVGSGRGVTVLDFVRVLAQKTRAQISPEIPGTYRAGDSRHAISSVSRLQSLGWKPKKGLNEILDDYLAWLASEHNRGDRAELAVESMGRAGIIRHGAAREHAHTAGD